MKLLKVPERRGQEVYIDLDWINARDEDGFYFFMAGDMETPGKIERREVVNFLIDLGYNVITDSSEVSEDAFFFTPCLDKHINKDAKEYSSKKNKKISESLKMTNVSFPFTLGFPDEEFPRDVPKLPFVLKNVKEEGGIDKVLIRTEEQLEIFKKFYDEIYDYSFKEAIKQTKRKWGLGDNIVFDEDGNSNCPISISRINYKKRLHEDFVMQEYIETPTEYNTTLRVVVSSSGDIFGASLKYASPKKMAEEGLYGLVDRYLLCPDSPYYLGSESIISNTVAGGNSILLGKWAYSEVEQEVLKAHGIDSSNASVPKDVEEAALAIISNCRREIGAISGIDFIFDSKTKTWKYLEQQEYPMMNTYCEAWELPYVTDKEDLGKLMDTQRRADIDARLRALALTVMRKNVGISDNKMMIKK